MTPEEIQQARDRVINQLYRIPDSDAVTVAKSDLRAVLALIEQQPEPVSRKELMGLVRDAWTSRPFGVGGVSDALLSRYTITRKPQDDAGRGEHQ